MPRTTDARSTREQAGPTSAVPTHTVVVRRVEQVADRLRCLTLEGLPDLGPLAPDAFFLAIRPRAGSEHLLDEGAPFAAYRDLPERRRPDWAYYTAHRWRPCDGELDLWVVLHDGGPMSRWARHARPGERLALWGPRMSWDVPDRARSLLLVGDETGLAAMTRAAAPAAAERVTMVVEADADVPVPGGPRVEVVRVDRRGRRPGADPTLLRDAVADLPLEPHGLHVLGAGEGAAVTAVGRHLRARFELPRGRVQVVSYWRATSGEQPAGR